MTKFARLISGSANSAEASTVRAEEETKEVEERQYTQKGTETSRIGGQGIASQGQKCTQYKVKIYSRNIF